MLTYCPLNEEYADRLLPIWADEDVIKYTNIQSPCTLEGIRSRINRLKFFDVFVVIEDESVIGVIGCPCIDKEKSQYGIFYQFCKAAWGKGIATAAAEWLLHYMGEKYPNVTLFANVVVDNVASERILNRLGFQQVSEGMFERNGREMKVHSYLRH